MVNRLKNLKLETNMLSGKALNDSRGVHTMIIIQILKKMDYGANICCLHLVQSYHLLTRPYLQ